LQGILERHPNAELHVVVAAVRTAIDTGHITPDDRVDFEEAGERGRAHGEQNWVLQKLRRSKVRFKGLSSRQFVAALRDNEHHIWNALSVILDTPLGSPDRQMAAAHSWSVINEAAGMVAQHRKLLILYGEADVDTRVRDIVRTAFDDGDIQPPLAPVTN